MGPGPLHRRAAASVAAAVLAAAVGCSGSPSAQSSPSATSTVHQAAAANIDKRVQAFLDLDYSASFDNVRAVVVTVDGRVVYERYPNSSASVTGNVFSVTKSVMSTLVGIALDEGHLRGVDSTLAELLPSHTAAMTPEVRSITLHQLLTMTSGLPGESAFGRSRNWVDSILREGTEQPPGQGFTYSNAGSHLLSAILTEATGRSTLDYAQEKLFGPLGIDTTPAAEPVAVERNLPAYERAGFAWPRDPQGHHTGYNFLKLTARDMEKLGRLWLDQGRWDNRQVVSAGWVEEATRPQVDTNGTPDKYGYQWWVTTTEGHPAFAAMGSEGQLIEVVPDLGLVVVIASAAGSANAGSDIYLELVAEIASEVD